MHRHALVIPLAIALLAPAQPAAAASSIWQEVEGASIRLVTASAPDEDGTLRGAIEIRLEENWKTYWREPGESGVPPQIDLEKSVGVQAARIDFPAPFRFEDGVSFSAGYSGHVALPATIELDPGNGDGFSLDLFLGLCETICVPVQVVLDIDLSAPSGRLDDLVVDRAFAALPEAATNEFGISASRLDGEMLEFDMALPGADTSADLFLAGNEGMMLSTPRREGDRFVTRILQWPRDGAAPQIDYTITAGARAASGIVALESPR